jgi:hypothetical protein
MAALHFDIDAEGVESIILNLAATERQVQFALSRAAGRTATTLRTMAARSMKDELQLRVIGLLRKRLKTLRLRQTTQEGFVLWFGLNDMPVSWFKGTPKQEASGAKFRDKAFDGGFVAKSNIKARRTVFKRNGEDRLPITEQQMPIADRAQVVVEDEIFVKAGEIFLRNFERDLRARVNYRLGAA